MWLNNEPNGSIVFVQYINNILFFIPYVFLLREIACFRWQRIFFIGVIASLCVEIAQYITARGLAELDDVISNLLGATIVFFIKSKEFVNCEDKK